MALFGTVDVMGPAHRGAQIQQLAQSAAQNVMRRQRMRALVRSGAAAAAGGPASSGSPAGQGGTGVRFRGSTTHLGIGMRGSITRPAITADQLAQMASLAGARGTLPGGGDGSFGGQFAAGGGGFDFGALPDPNDPRQSSTASLPTSVSDQGQPPAPAVTPQPNMTLDQLNAQLTAAGQPTQSYPTTITPSGSTGQTNAQLPPDQRLNLPGDAPVISSSMIPLGNGVFYNPETDTIHIPGKQM